MNPRFPADDIDGLEQHYWNHLSEVQRERENNIIQNTAPAFRQRGYLTMGDLVLLTQWKSPRNLPRVRQNSDGFVGEVTTISLSGHTPEELRIKILTILDGVQWSIASVVLHFVFPDQYPILDYRVIWSLQEPQPATYKFDFWMQYTQFCQGYIREHNVSMRSFDRALWTYSKENQ